MRVSGRARWLEPSVRGRRAASRARIGAVLFGLGSGIGCDADGRVLGVEGGAAALADAGAAPDLDAETGAAVDRDVDGQADGADAAGVTPGADAAAQAGAALGPGPDLVDARRPALCERRAVDAVRDVFCGAEPARIGGLRALQSQLRMEVVPAALDDASAGALQLGVNVFVDGAVFLGHSTALAGRLVSPINPRVLLLGRVTFMAFQRGAQQVELATVDRESGRLNLYLVTFRQACNTEPGGCTPGHLYTPRIERDWVSVELRDDEDLKNTPDDCRQCHQRNRPSPILLMRELRGPWTHFFAPPANGEYRPGARPSGPDLVRDFEAVKAGELYGGVPAAVAAHTAGTALENRVDPGQPVSFHSANIESELAAAAADAGPARSPTWDEAFQAFKRGEQLALPYYELRPTDPAKQADLARAYQRYRADELGLEQLPDLAEIFPDDPQRRAEIGLQTEPGASAAETLIQACGSCHNDVLDQSISRARFSIALSRMSREELALAVERIEQRQTEPGVMPPPAARQLDAAGRQRLLAYLRASSRSAEDDALLERAARLGMAKDPWISLNY